MVFLVSLGKSTLYDTQEMSWVTLLIELVEHQRTHLSVPIVWVSYLSLMETRLKKLINLAQCVKMRLVLFVLRWIPGSSWCLFSPCSLLARMFGQGRRMAWEWDVEIMYHLSFPGTLRRHRGPFFPKDKRDGKVHLHFFLLLVSHRNCIPMVFPLPLLWLQFEIFLQLIS